MKLILKQVFVMVLIVAMVPMVSFAQKKVSVTLPPDGPNKVIKGTFKGSTNSSSFNLLSPDESAEALHRGEIDGNNFSGKIAKSGIYTIRVSQMRSAARKGTSVSFTLTLSNTSPK